MILSSLGVPSLIISSKFANNDRSIGTLIGAYATANRGEGNTKSYISRWRYAGLGQKIDNDVFVPSKPALPAGDM